MILTIWHLMPSVFPDSSLFRTRIEYRTRTHHTNMDTYERLVMDDLKQMAVIVASFVYNTAQREAQIPRKPTNYQ